MDHAGERHQFWHTMNSACLIADMFALMKAQSMCRPAFPACLAGLAARL
jgi:hypothetical protein